MFNLHPAIASFVLWNKSPDGFPRQLSRFDSSGLTDRLKAAPVLTRRSFGRAFHPSRAQPAVPGPWIADSPHR